MPRPTKCTPELTAKICKLIRTGCTIVSACVAVGITYRLYRKWMVLGGKGKAPFEAFFDDANQAEAIALGTMAQKLFNGDEAWRAAIRFLERRDPENWARRKPRGVERPGRIHVTFNVPEMEPTEASQNADHQAVRSKPLNADAKKDLTPTFLDRHDRETSIRNGHLRCTLPRQPPANHGALSSKEQSPLTK